MRYYILFILLFFNIASICFADNKYADSCYVAGIDEYKKSNYIKALHLFEKCDSTNKTNNRTVPYYSSNSIAWIANCFYMIGDSIKAESILSNYWGISYRVTPTDQRTTVIPDSIAALVDKLEEENNYQEAIATIDTLIQVERDNLTPTHTYIANSYVHKGILLQKLNDFEGALCAFEEAIRLWIKNDYRAPNTLLYIMQFINKHPIKESIDVYERTTNLLKGIDHLDNSLYIKVLCYYASCYDALGSYQNANIKKEEIFQKIEQTKTSNTIIHADILSVLGINCYNLNDFENAIRYLKEELRIRQNILGNDNFETVSTLKNIYYCYYKQNKYFDAIKFATKALLIIEKELGKEHPNALSMICDIENLNSYLGNYNEAINLNKKALTIQEKVTGKESKEYHKIAQRLTYYYSITKNYSEAIKIENENLLLLEKTVGKENQEYASLLLSLAIHYSFMDNHLEAVKLNTEAMMILEKIVGKDHPDFARSISNLAVEKERLGHIEEALSLNKEVAELRKKNLGSEHPDYVLSIENLAHNNKKLGNYAEAIRLYTEACDIQERIYGKDHNNYALSLDNLAFAYMNTNNYTEAIKLYNETLDILEKNNGKIHLYYATSLRNLALTHSHAKNYSEAIMFYTEALNIYKTLYGKENSEYIITLSGLASTYLELQNHYETIKSYNELLILQAKVYGKYNSGYVSSLIFLASTYTNIRKYSEAIGLYTEALAIQEKTCGHEHPDFISTLNDLAYVYYSIGNYSESIKLYKESLNIQEKIKRKDHIDYATTLNCLALNYSAIGNTNESVVLDSEALEIYSKNKDGNMNFYAKGLNNLAMDYAALGNFQEAFVLLSKAQKVFKDNLGETHPLYLTLLKNMAFCYTGLGLRLNAIESIKESLEKCEKIYGKDGIEFAEGLLLLALYEYQNGNNKEAISNNSQALKIINKILGSEHPTYSNILMNQVMYYKNGKNKKDHIALINQYLKMKIKNILNTIQTLVPREREIYWGKEMKQLEFMSYNQTYTYNNSELNKLAYNSSLLIKGFLLGAELETKKILQESGDEGILNLYDELQSNRKILDKLYETPLSERIISTDSLEQVIEEQERQLSIKSVEYGSILNNMSITWKDVQKKLKKDDIAIEFISFPLKNDSVIYVAYTLRKDYDAPKMIKLFEEKKLNSIRPARFYKGKNIYNLVWAPLEEELAGTHNVYFSPTGVLYNINIEVLPEIAAAEEKRNYYRLSSTRELAYKHTNSRINNNHAVVYGGMNYDMEFNASDRQRANDSDGDIYGEYKFNADSISLRSGWNYLPGTLIEAKTVSRVLNESETFTDLYIDTIATESSFKALSGQGRKLIHIATHGFFYMDRDSVKMEQDGFKLFGDNTKKKQSVEDKSLTRSGMLFSGCKSVLEGIKVPEGYEDGILYAKEIAQLDLRGLDHITLSACETGLGDITGEGVFGLQRAFKKAGAHSILMTLWKVDDNATRMFMSRFYHNYLSKHMPKAEALLDAQSYIRNFEEEIKNADGIVTKIKKYEDPKYWAAFIILDAI